MKRNKLIQMSHNTAHETLAFKPNNTQKKKNHKRCIFFSDVKPTRVLTNSINRDYFQLMSN